MPEEYIALGQNHERILETVEKLCCLIIWPLSKILPTEKWPIVAVIMIFVTVWLMVEFIV